MTTTNNITTSTVTMNIYNNPYQTITRNTKLLENNSQTVYIPTKICKTCRTIKYVTEFYKDKSRFVGYAYRCKFCQNNSKKEYVKQNKDKVADTLKQYYEQNKDKISEYNKEYRNLNKDKIT